MEFQIPKPAEDPLEEFIKFDAEQASKLIEAIRVSKPALEIDEFATRVASRSGLEPQTVKSILSVFAGMYLARINEGKPVEEFVSDLSDAIKKRKDKKLMPADWDIFLANIREILTCEDSLGVTAKAFDLLMDNERDLDSSRIITDVRHIFSDDPSHHSKAAVIVHILNLVYEQLGSKKEIYIALDASDLKKLKSAIERAETKEANLKKMLMNSGIDCLENKL